MAYKHGHTGNYDMSPTYRSWNSMRGRCNNPNDPSYADYGARGITVCERWQVFENFLADMGERPDGTTIDRKDNNGNYDKDNCHWNTIQNQNRNRRTTKLTLEAVVEIAYQRITTKKPAGMIAEEFGVSIQTMSDITSRRSWTEAMDLALHRAAQDLRLP